MRHSLSNHRVLFFIALFPDSASGTLKLFQVDVTETIFTELQNAEKKDLKNSQIMSFENGKLKL